MSFNLRPKTKEEEKKLEVGSDIQQKSPHISTDIADIQKKFSPSSTGPARPPPPRPMARNRKETTSPAEPSAGKKTSQSSISDVDRGVIVDNSAAGLQQRKSLTFLSAKKSNKTSAKKHTSRVLKSSRSESESGLGEVAADSSLKETNGDNSSASDDEPVIVEWKDEDSSEFSSIKPSKFGGVLRESDSTPAVRMSVLAATADDSPPHVRQNSSAPSVPVATSVAPAAVIAPLVTPRDAPVAKGSAKRKTFRKADIEQKVSPFASLPASIPSRESTESSKRFRVCQEIYASEYSYVRNLEVLVEVYKAALKPVLSNKDLDCVFVNVESIYGFNCELLNELHKIFDAFTEETTVGFLFTSRAARFNVYSVFCANHRAAEETVARLKRKSDVQDALAAAGQDTRVAGGLNLQSYLLTPVQRMPRYLLLLQNLLKNTADSHPDFELLRDAIGKLDTITEHVNQQIREQENQRALSGLRNQVIGLDAHDLPGRKLVKEGQVCLTSIRKLYQCILFNDLMVFALRGDTKGKVEIALDLGTVWVHDLGNNDPQTTSDDAIEIFTPDRPYTIYVKSVNEKRLWLNEIRSTILGHLKEQKDDLEPPSDLEERTGIASERQTQAAIVRASDVVHRCAKFNYANGLSYDGCWLDGMRHGKGEMTWCDTTVYEGDWVENERVGNGKLTYNTAETYNGAWVNDMQCGQGSLTFCSGDSYVGNWQGALPQGDGKVEYNNGDIFKGTFDQGTICGEGTLTCKNGIMYDGQWLESQFDGEGRHTNRFGDQFAGELVHNCYHGSGVMRYKDGSIYDGIWEKGHRHGFGSFRDPKGVEYNGNWRLDQRHGQGYQKYADGSVYDGEWEYNARHGPGKMRWANGDEYSGMFKHDHAHGRGTMTYSDGAAYIGDFKFGQRHGYGVMEYANGGHYDGSWVHNFREGDGTYNFEDESYTGEFSHDRPHGKGMYSHTGSSTTYTGLFMAGKRCGQGIETSPMGKFDGEWKYGMRHGLGKETSTVGTVVDGTWHCSQRTGIFSVRSVTGEVTEISYQAGMLVGDASAHDVPNMPILPRTMM